MSRETVVVNASAVATKHAAVTVLLAAPALVWAAWNWSATAEAASLDQGEIAFVRDGDIWVMNDDGSRQTPLTDNEEFSDSDPAWSPDGERIAFARRYLDGEFEAPRSDIWVMNADGSDQTNLTNHPDEPPYGAESPTWAPDGERIAFASNRDWTTLDFPFHSASQIWVMNADGSDPIRLTEGDRHGDDDSDPLTHLRRHPAWSPDGERIAYNNGGIWVMGADGSDQTRAGSGTMPAWSPDGQRLAYREQITRFDHSFESFYVQVMNADGSGVTRLTRGAWSRPAWSPDGQRIAFGGRAHAPRLHSSIWTMRLDGSCLTNLTRHPTLIHEDGPAWHPLSPPSQERPCFTLSVSVSGAGAGGVDGPAIRCGGFLDGSYDECAASFARGTRLTLTARPRPPLVLAGWRGACTGADHCELTMDRDRHVSPRFVQGGRPPRLVISRARVLVGATAQNQAFGRLVVRGSGAGSLSGTFRAAGNEISVRATRPHNDRRFVIREVLRGFERPIRAGQLRLRHTGNRRMRPVGVVRLRAARRPARLRLGRTRLEGNRLVVAGRVRPRARRQARIQVKFNRPNGAAAQIGARARVNQRGRFHTRLRVPRAVRNRGAWVSVTHPGRGLLFGQRRGVRVGG